MTRRRRPTAAAAGAAKSKVNRPTSKLTPERRRTYQIAAPPGTHTRPASCAEVDCGAWRNGWVTVVDESTELGQRQAHYIRRVSPRRYRETRDQLGTRFEFPAGQDCFGEHTVRLDREPFYVVRGGDWRGNPRGEVRRHRSGDDWMEDLHEHTDRLAEAQQ